MSVAGTSLPDPWGSNGPVARHSTRMLIEAAIWFGPNVGGARGPDVDDLAGRELDATGDWLRRSRRRVAVPVVVTEGACRGGCCAGCPAEHGRESRSLAPR